MKRFKKFLMAVVAIATVSANGYAFDLSKLSSALSGNETVSSLINGVISTDNVSVSDIAGTWTYSSPAISFKSSNLLEKAGGTATSTAIESKLSPYFKKAGLEGSKFTFDESGNVTLTLSSGKSIKGTVKQGTTDGTLLFSFSSLGSKLGSLTAYVTKGTQLSIMFDVSKLQSLVSAVAKVSNNSTVSSVSTLLSNYEGIYAGFKMSK